MEAIVNLRDLLLAQLTDLYNAEMQEMRNLPLLRDNARSIELQKIIGWHIVETHEQMKRLDCVFQSVHAHIHAEEHRTIRCLADEALELCRRCANPEVRDAAIITAIQHINHYEIAGYGASCTYANALNANEIAASLHESLEEERKMNDELSRIARGKINARAVKTTRNTSFSPASLISILGAY